MFLSFVLIKLDLNNSYLQYCIVITLKIVNACMFTERDSHTEYILNMYQTSNSHFAIFSLQLKHFSSNNQL